MSSGGGAGAGAGAGLSHAELHAERRKEKVKKVSDYRTAMLARVNKPQGGKATAERKTETFVAPVRYENVLPEVPAIVTSPFRASVAGVVPRLSASVSKVRLALPAVSVRAASTWIVWAESLAPPEIDIDDDTCIDIGVDSATGT